MTRREETSTNLAGNWTTPLAEKISTAWFQSLALQHKLPDSVRYMQGMSGRKYRSFINNLVGSIPNARYLEVGSWAGSTACSVMYGNTCKVTCIDNWSEFGGPRDRFIANVNESINPNVDFSFIEQDFRKVDYSTIGKFNVYMFDGPHSEQDQYDGVMIAQAALDDEYILVVDDWNIPHVQAGTARALTDLEATVVCQIGISTHLDGQHPEQAFENSDWHDGYYIALVNKKVDSR